MVDSSKKWYIAVLNVISWIFGILFFISIIANIFGKYDLGGLIMSIILTVLLIPPLRKKVVSLFHYGKINIKNNYSIKKETPSTHKSSKKPTTFKVYLQVIIAVFGILIFLVIMESLFFNGNIFETKKVYASGNLEDIHFDFTSKYSDLTDVQKKELWEEYEGKWINGTVFVNSVDKNLFGTYVILGTFQPKGQYDIGNDVALFLDNSQSNKITQINKGSIIIFEGKLETYHSIMGNIDLEKVILLN